MAADGWLTPAHKATAPYEFVAGSTLSLPNGTGWTIFNAASTMAEVAGTYTVADGTSTYTAGTLHFVPPMALQEDESAYLTLGIRAENGTDLITMKPADPMVARMRTDRVYATVRMIPSDATPPIDTLKKMYSSYAASQPGAGGEEPEPTAAKLGLCVLQDGYFYVSRVHGGGTIDGTTGLPQDFVYEFCKTKVRYEDLGSGDITLCVEFRSFQLPPDEEGGMARPVTRAYRILAKPANADDADYKSLTAGRGYAWAVEMNASGTDYAFDWDSFEASDDSEWLYALDGTIPFTEGFRYDLSTLNTLSEMGFSASEGGLLKAWLQVDNNVQTLASLTGLNAANFTPYLEDINSTAFSAYADWAADYDVTLSDYLANARARTATSLTDEAFDAFLLYMDPANTETRRLLISGLVPKDDTITLTVLGPDGSNLARALGKGISGIRLCRAATLDALATATPKSYTPSFDSEGNVILVLPKEEEGVEKPFMKAELVSVFSEEE